MNVTLGQLVDAFAAWEKDYRADVSAFLSHEEVQLMDVGDVSTQRAIYLMALLRKEAA